MKYWVSVLATKNNCFFVVLLLTITSAFAERTAKKTPEEILRSWNNIEAIVKGEHLRAILSAYEDFSKDVNPSRNLFIRENYGDSSLAAYGSNIDNYHIEVRTGGEGYTIVFKLKLSDKYPALQGSGGTTRYIVDPKTFKIIRIDKQK